MNDVAACAGLEQEDSSINVDAVEACQRLHTCTIELEYLFPDPSDVDRLTRCFQRGVLKRFACRNFFAYSADGMAQLLAVANAAGVELYVNADHRRGTISLRVERVVVLREGEQLPSDLIKIGFELAGHYKAGEVFRVLLDDGTFSRLGSMPLGYAEVQAPVDMSVFGTAQSPMMLSPVAWSEYDVDTPATSQVGDARTEALGSSWCRVEKLEPACARNTRSSQVQEPSAQHNSTVEDVKAADDMQPPLRHG